MQGRRRPDQMALGLVIISLAESEIEQEGQEKRAFFVFSVFEYLLFCGLSGEICAGIFSHFDQNFLMVCMAIESLNGSGHFSDLLVS